MQASLQQMGKQLLPEKWQWATKKHPPVCNVMDKLLMPENVTGEARTHTRKNCAVDTLSTRATPTQHTKARAVDDKVGILISCIYAYVCNWKSRSDADERSQPSTPTRPMQTRQGSAIEGESDFI
jgi:hypothetical protein